MSNRERLETESEMSLDREEHNPDDYSRTGNRRQQMEDTPSEMSYQLNEKTGNSEGNMEAEVDAGCKDKKEANLLQEKIKQGSPEETSCEQVRKRSNDTTEVEIIIRETMADLKGDMTTAHEALLKKMDDREEKFQHQLGSDLGDVLGELKSAIKEEVQGEAEEWRKDIHNRLTITEGKAIEDWDPWPALMMVNSK